MPTKKPKKRSFIGDVIHIVKEGRKQKQLKKKIAAKQAVVRAMKGGAVSLKAKRDLLDELTKPPRAAKPRKRKKS